MAVRPEPVPPAPVDPGPVPDCATCGACCREAFDTVPLSADDDATIDRQPAMVVVDPDGWWHLARVPSPTGCGTRCAALTGDGAATTPFRCRIYGDRPAACSELDAGSESCLFARWRVGLEPHPPEVLDEVLDQ
ncbi:MAG: YkgJ family cysteine cluster protein [Myxococcota bacterium]